MAERNTEVIRTEIAAERRGLEGDLVMFRGDIRRFAVRAAVAAGAVVVGLLVIRSAARMLFRRS